jgi:hypothetical protein
MSVMPNVVISNKSRSTPKVVVLDLCWGPVIPSPCNRAAEIDDGGKSGDVFGTTEAT